MPLGSVQAWLRQEHEVGPSEVPRMTSLAKPARDEWLLATLDGMLTIEQLAQLRAQPVERLWDEVVKRNLAPDDDLVSARRRYD